MAAIQEQLKLKIEQLRGLKDVSPIPLRGKIILAYREEVLDGISKIIDINGGNEEQLLTNLELFLEENWKKYAISPVGYTALPDDPITEFLCDIATEIALKLKNKEIAPIHILMPGVQTQVTVDSNVYSDLDSLPIKQVIKTHIINRNGRYLLPVKFLIQITPSGVETDICNHYYDALTVESEDIYDGALAYLNSEEKHRLLQHSDETRAVMEAKRQLDILTSDSSNLLTQLNTLISALRFHSKQGLGSEGAASEGVYILILNFQQFYDKLTPEKKDNIPASVRKEIDLLLNITAKTEERYNQAAVAGNDDPQPTITTCIDTRQKMLSDAMRGYEATLADSTLSAESNSELITDATNALAETQKILLEKIKSPVAYKGADSIKIPDIAFLNSLKINFSISHIEDLDLLSVDDFKLLCKDKNYCEQIIAAFKGDQNKLISFMFLSKPDMLGAVLSEFSDALFDTCMKQDPYNIGRLLNELDSERFEIACMAMSNYFKGIFYGGQLAPGNFIDKLSYELSPEKRFFLISKIIDTNRLDSIAQFLFLINRLNRNQKKKIIKIHIEALSSKPHSTDDLKAMLRVMPERIFDFLKSFDDFISVKNLMSRESFEKLVESEMARICDLLTSLEDLVFLQQSISKELFERFMQVQTERSPGKFSSLEYPQRKEFLEGGVLMVARAMRTLPLGDKLLWGEGDFGRIMKHLTVEQRTQMFEEAKPFALCCPNSYLSEELVKYITPQQRVEFFAALLNGDKDALESWISTITIDTFFTLADLLDKDKATFESITEHLMKAGKLAKCIFKDEDISKLYGILAPEQKKVFKSQWMAYFLPSYTARLSFFSNPLSARWSKDTDPAEVLKYAGENETSRTADVVWAIKCQS